MGVAAMRKHNLFVFEYKLKHFHHFDAGFKKSRDFVDKAVQLSEIGDYYVDLASKYLGTVVIIIWLV